MGYFTLETHYILVMRVLPIPDSNFFGRTLEIRHLPVNDMIQIMLADDPWEAHKAILDSYPEDQQFGKRKKITTKYMKRALTQRYGLDWDTMSTDSKIIGLRVGTMHFDR